MKHALECLPLGGALFVPCAFASLCALASIACAAPASEEEGLNAFQLEYRVEDAEDEVDRLSSNVSIAQNALAKLDKEADGEVYRNAQALVYARQERLERAREYQEELAGVLKAARGRLPESRVRKSLEDARMSLDAESRALGLAKALAGFQYEELDENRQRQAEAIARIKAYESTMAAEDESLSVKTVYERNHSQIAELVSAFDKLQREAAAIQASIDFSVKRAHEFRNGIVKAENTIMHCEEALIQAEQETSELKDAARREREAVYKARELVAEERTAQEEKMDELLTVARKQVEFEKRKMK